MNPPEWSTRWANRRDEMVRRVDPSVGERPEHPRVAAAVVVTAVIVLIIALAVGSTLR